MAFDIPGALGEGYSAQEIIDHLKDHPEDSPNFDIAGALKEGYSASDIVDHLNPNVARNSEQGVPVIAPIQRGLAQTSAQVANLADDLGFHSTASDIRGRIPQGDLNAPTSGAGLVSDIKAGKIGSAISDLPSAALEQFLPTAAGIAGGLVTGGAGPAAAIAGRIGAGAGIGAVSQGDAIARQRAANNGETSPSGSDLALGLATGAAQGGVGAIGLGGSGGGLRAGLMAAVRHAGADAIQPDIAALGSSVGTNAGASLASPADMAASALTGLTTRVGMGAPEAFKSISDSTPAAKAAALAMAYKAMTPDQQAYQGDLVGATNALNEAHDTAIPAPTETRTSAAARTASQRLLDQAQTTVDSMDRAGLLPDGGSDSIMDIMKQARNSQRVVGAPEMAQIDSMGLDPQTSGLLKSTASQLNMLSDAGIANRNTSWMGKVGGLLGRAAGFSAGSMVGHPFAGAEVGGVSGRTIGNTLADHLGLTDPPLIKAANNAQAMLDAAGVTIPATGDNLAAAVDANNNMIVNQARLMGLDPKTALSKGLDAATGDKFRQDYADAMSMNKQMDSQAVTTAANRVAAQPMAPVDPTAVPQAPVAQQAPLAPAQPSPIDLAVQRAAAANPSGPSGVQSQLAAQAQPMPGIEGLSREAMQQGKLLPDWQYGIGKNVLDALSVRGTPQNLNLAQVSKNAVASLQAKGAFSPEFGSALMSHDGRVVRGLYNLIRNEALMTHGVDHRTIEAQSNSPQNVP